MNNIVLFMIYFFIFGLLDLLWLGFVVDGYRTQLADLARFENGNIQPYWPAALVAYICLALAPIVFVFPYTTESTPLITFFCKGALLGMVIYGTYEFTNLAVLKEWKWSMVVLDFGWGIVLSALAVTVTAFIAKHFQLLPPA